MQTLFLLATRRIFLRIFRDYCRVLFAFFIIIFFKTTYHIKVKEFYPSLHFWEFLLKFVSHNYIIIIILYIRDNECINWWSLSHFVFENPFYFIYMHGNKNK